MYDTIDTGISRSSSIVDVLFLHEGLSPTLILYEYFISLCSLKINIFITYYLIKY